MAYELAEYYGRGPQKKCRKEFNVQKFPVDTYRGCKLKQWHDMPCEDRTLESWKGFKPSQACMDLRVKRVRKPRAPKALKPKNMRGTRKAKRKISQAFQDIKNMAKQAGFRLTYIGANGKRRAHTKRDLVAALQNEGMIPSDV
jgi:hypothetical protein